jgi:predicted transcriptional regulator
MIVQHLLNKGLTGATRQEISDDLGIKLQTVCGRVRELVLAGELKDTDATRGERPQRVVVIA